jgi:hypothetical protein
MHGFPGRPERRKKPESWDPLGRKWAGPESTKKPAPRCTKIVSERSREVLRRKRSARYPEAKSSVQPRCWSPVRGEQAIIPTKGAKNKVNSRCRESLPDRSGFQVLYKQNNIGQLWCMNVWHLVVIIPSTRDTSEERYRSRQRASV